MNKYFVVVSLLLNICLIGCSQKQKELVVTSNSVSQKDSLLNAFVKERKWQNFCKLDKIGLDTILYKRYDLNNNFVGLLDLKSGWVGEALIPNIKFYPKTMYLYRVFLKEDNKIMVFKAQGKDNDSLLSYFYMNKDTITAYVSFQGEIHKQRNHENDENVYVEDVKIKIDNIAMNAFVCVNESGVEVLELRGLDGVWYGNSRDIVSMEDRKQLVDKIRKGIVDKIVKNGTYSFFNQIPNVEYYVNEGKHNAMRFNDKYRNNSIDVCGIVQDIDEPWGTRYKYRVKLDRCNILTDNRSVLNLNKGDYAYIRGVCSNFDSNSYQLTMVDGFILTNEHAENFVRTMMNRAEDVLDERLRSIGDYNIYYEDALVSN